MLKVFRREIKKPRFYVLSLAAIISGLTYGINFPTKIACSKEFSLCYLLRFNKDEIVTPKTCERNPQDPLCAAFQKTQK